VLSDAAAGAARLHKEWGSPQQFVPSVLLTDKTGPVTSEEVYKAIQNVLEPGNLDQLAVYFAGHGVNVRTGEYWLLSNAPRKAHTAVNVRGMLLLGSTAWTGALVVGAALSFIAAVIGAWVLLIEI
jgi:hypothetical protein